MLVRFIAVLVATIALPSLLAAQERSDQRQASAEHEWRCPSSLRRIPPGVQSAPTISSFVLYAERSITIDRKSVVCGGDIGVRSSATRIASQLTMGPEDFSDLSHNLLAPSVTLNEDTRVGTVQANTLNGTALNAFPISSMPALPFGAPPVTGTTNITIPREIEYGLVPGKYGILDVAGAVLLTQGDYAFSQITLEEAARLIAVTSGVRVFVEKTLVVNSDATIRPAADHSAGDLFISVSGSEGERENGQPAVVFGPRSRIRAIVSAPYGILAMEDHVEGAGAFAAFDVTLADHVHVDFQSGITPEQAYPHGQQQLSGYFTPPTDPTILPLVGPVPPTAEIPLTISLPVRDPAALDNLANNVSDPNSPNFRQFLTVDQFTTMFGPAAADYNALIGWAQTAGFQVTATHQNRVLISARATAAQIERAIYANLVYRLRADGSTFPTVDRDPSIDLNVPILRISGLNETIPPTPKLNHDASADYPDPGSGPSGMFGGNDFRTAYAPGATETGKGQLVALFELDDFFPADVTAYRSQFGLPNVPIQKHTFDGIGGPGNNNGEVTLDIDMAMSMAPGLDAIALYEGKLANSIYGAIASPDGAVLPLQVSASWNYTVDSTTRQLMKQMAVQGQTVFVSSGDCGAYLADTKDDRDLPFVTVVGGTILSMTGTGTAYGAPETAWTLSGGGILTGGPTIPGYQVALGGVNGASVTFRNLPDVAAVANGVASAQNATGVLTPTGGTSVGAPLWAAFTALANERAQKAGKASVGFANPLLYTLGGGANYATDFHDVTGGTSSTGGAAKNGCAVPPPAVVTNTAGIGYDLTTGWGSPQAALLTGISQALANIQSVTMIIGTGHDNARSDTELQATLPGVPTICLKPSNNASSDSVCPNGGSARDQQGNQEWKNWTTSTQVFSFPQVPAPSLTTLQIKLFEHDDPLSGESDDNWDIQSITVIANDANGDTATLLNVGNAANGDNCIVRLKAATPSFTFNLSQGNPTGANPGIPPGSCPQ